MWEKHLRLASGLILAAYLIPHLINVSLGLISLEAMEDMRRLLKSVWHIAPLSLLLYASLLMHVVLALYSLYRRTTLKMPLWEGLQLGLGLSIVPLLLPHLINTRGRETLLGQEVSYEFYLTYLWDNSGQWEQLLLLLTIVWVHLAIGLYYWLRLKLRRTGWLYSLKTVLVLIPLFAAFGFIHMGRHLYEQQNITANLALNESTADAARLLEWEPLLQGIFISALLVVLLLRLLRAFYRSRLGTIAICHSDAGIIKAQKGQTLLEALRQAGVPHSSICGGRGRCTTCQVRVTEGLEDLPRLTAAERKALAGIGASPAVRLACQLRVCGEMSVTPLVPHKLGLDYLRRPAGGLHGQELAVAAVVVDLRGSTLLGEKRLPYDVVFILNQFFTEMTEALEETGGHYAQFNGDGLMALYGLEQGLEKGCRNAIQGAQAMLNRLQRINRRLDKELNTPLRIGIGIHSGEAIVGTMGPPSSPIISAIGDNINIAAHLEAETKHYDCTLMISKVTAERAKIPLDDLPVLKLKLKGKVQELEAIVVRTAAEIDQMVREPTIKSALELRQR